MNTPSAGVSVTERTAQGIPVVYACDKVIKQDVAKTTIYIKKWKDAKGGREVDREHPLFRTLHDAPNPVMTPYELKETLQFYVNMWGNGYAEIVRKDIITSVTPKRRLEVQLWPLDASRMTLDLDGLNRLRYTYAMPDGGRPKVWTFDPDNPPVFHLRQNTRDGIHGRPPIQVLRETMGTRIASERFIGRMYGQGGHPRTALSTKERLSPEAARRIRQDYEALTVGEHNWHRVVVLDHDLKPVPLVMPNRDAQFVELMRLGRDELCGAYRVAAHKVGNLERSTNNNIEHQAIEHVGDCLVPHFVNWAQAVKRDLLDPVSIGTHFAVFDLTELLKSDSKALNDALHLQRQDGVITGNDYRRLVGYDDQISAADGGDVLLVNGTMVPIGDAGKKPPPPTPNAPPPTE